MLEFIGGVIVAFFVGYALFEGVATVWDFLTPGQRSKDAVTIGSESLLGRLAVVARDFESSPNGGSSRGAVRVSGETWTATLDSGVIEVPRLGDRVKVVGVDGLLLEVVPDGEA